MSGKRSFYQHSDRGTLNFPYRCWSGTLCQHEWETSKWSRKPRDQYVCLYDFCSLCWCACEDSSVCMCLCELLLVLCSNSPFCIQWTLQLDVCELCTSCNKEMECWMQILRAVADISSSLLVSTSFSPRSPLYAYKWGIPMGGFIMNFQKNS